MKRRQQERQLYSADNQDTLRSANQPITEFQPNINEIPYGIQKSPEKEMLTNLHQQFAIQEKSNLQEKSQQEGFDDDITNGQINEDKLKTKINKSENFLSIDRMIKNRNFNYENPIPVLLLGIQSDNQNQSVSQHQSFSLSKEDIKQVFKNYGSVSEIIMKDAASAYVVFHHQIEAVYAIRHLNGYRIEQPQYSLTLSVTWYGKQPPKQLSISPPEQKLRKLSFTSKDENRSQNSNRSDDKNKIQLHHGKYTCRYEVQITKDKDFDVPKRIIGSRGSKMKEIIKKCEKKFSYLKRKDLVKLRLRGQGSGHKEGPHKQESKEAMHLCVSSKNQQVFEFSQRLVEELLTKIYQQYNDHCKAKGIICDKVLQIKKMNRRRRYEGKKSNKKGSQQSRNQRSKKHKSMKMKKNKMQMQDNVNNNYMQNMQRIIGRGDNKTPRYNNQMYYPQDNFRTYQSQKIPPEFIQTNYNSIPQQRSDLSSERNFFRANQFNLQPQGSQY